MTPRDVSDFEWLGDSGGEWLSWIRPNSAESTTSRPICEVKQLQAWIVLRSVMTREPQVLYPFCIERIILLALIHTDTHTNRHRCTHHTSGEERNQVMRVSIREKGTWSTALRPSKPRMQAAAPRAPRPTQVATKRGRRGSDRRRGSPPW